jgi:hypothetical protein
MGMLYAISFEKYTSSYFLRTALQNQASGSENSIPIWFPYSEYCLFVDEPMMPPLAASLKIMWIALRMSY